MTTLPLASPTLQSKATKIQIIYQSVERLIRAVDKIEELHSLVVGEAVRAETERVPTSPTLAAALNQDLALIIENKADNVMIVTQALRDILID